LNLLSPLLCRPALLLGAAVIALSAPAGEAPQPTVITSDTLDMRGGDADTISIFDGHVVVVATGLRLSCDHLEVVSARIGDKDDTVGQQDRFKSLIAVGNVRIIQGDREATCGRAEVRPREDMITLTNNPVVTDHGNGTVATGDPLVMMRRERHVRGKNVKITAPAIRDLGFDPKQAPPAPDAPKKSAPQ
jgi:lipopolysaccharide export system protein LptA